MLNIGTSKWTQFGWIKSKLDGGTTKREIFAHMYLSSSSVYWQFWSPKPVGTSTWYEILWTWSATWDFYVDGTHYQQWNGSFIPEDYQAFGETHDYVDQMPGGTSAHVTFVNTQYFTGSPRSSTWVTSSISATDSSIHGGSNPSTGRYEIWDKACSS